MSDDAKSEVGREITSCLDAQQQCLHLILGEASRFLEDETVEQLRASLLTAESAITKLKLRFPPKRR